MRPFFSYYGAKWTGAKHYGPPRRDLVIEPFAGSACYSTRWEPKAVHLYDANSTVCDLWHFLINCSERDIRAIPDVIQDTDHLETFSGGVRALLGFWVAKGRAECSNVVSPWYHQYQSATDCRVWGPAVKARIIAQKPLIKEWRIDQSDYRSIPLRDAHWHVDPPYNNLAGRRYPNQPASFDDLGDWCRSLPGAVDVCENVGADWLPFRPFYRVVSSRGRHDGKRSEEAIWRSDDLFAREDGP